MPKDEIDYSNTIIYKICCKDETIKDVYVGHTTNFVKRKYLHKMHCNNLSKKIDFYSIIRDNGGWDNWNMTEIAKYNCKTRNDARIKEQEHKNLLKIQTNNCPNHEILTNTYTKYENPGEKMSCKICNVECSNKYNYEKHLLTLKHKNTYILLTNTYTMDEKDDLPYLCNCGKSYKHRQSLYNHKKNCNPQIITIKDNKPTLDKDELIQYLIKENSEFKDLLVEQNKAVMKMCDNAGSVINNNQINSYNKTFNLNVFLNEQCKDAMNIMDFVDSLKLQLSDLETVGKLGYIEGISNIIVKNLKALDLHKRPVHCSDSKREVMYVKDQDKWEKENEDKNRLRKAIKRVAYKNTKLIPEFREKHPDCGKSDSPFSDQYSKLIIEAMGGKGNSDIEKEDKIIKRIAKEVTIDKNIII